ncbi:hypothetical protein EDB85DRAFT_1924002 [Lactarius pseudohatsudake]|nr:hypothetical protein EDB85DRAFT_1924002 [Lactarius pseudohatsudake]
MGSGQVFAIRGHGRRTVSLHLSPNLPPPRRVALVPPPPTLPPQPQPITITTCRTRVWISTSTSISLYSGTGPQMLMMSSTMTYPHSPPLATAGTHNHPDGPMLGFVIPDHDDVDYNPGAVDAGRAHTSPGKGLNFDLDSPNRAGGGSINWRARRWWCRC